MGLLRGPTGARAGAVRARAGRPGSAAVGEEETDDVLMGRVAAGHADAACRQLVDRHLHPVVQLAARILGDAAEAEDVAQETFVRLWAHAGRWRPNEARLSTWLHRVALNLCYDRRARRREVAADDAGESADPGADLADHMEGRDLSRHVRAEIMRLPESQRTAIALCHYQGMSNSEAAEIMNVTVEALESLLSRARRTLRDRLRSRAAELLGIAT
ncbi:MAG: RNA polymerase sigma factor [Candidatus Binatia bacterium]